MHFGIIHNLLFRLSHFRTARNDEAEQAILSEIRKCTEAVSTNVIEHTAYIRAAADKNDMDLDKYKNQVKNELQNANKSSGMSAMISHYN